MKWDHALLLSGAVIMAVGHCMGLFATPPEAYMGETGRILYLHAPTAWAAMLAYLLAFLAAIGALWTGRLAWDATVESSIELGVLLSVMLLFQGSIWAKPTWGIWWTWDARLTSTAIMLVAFIGVLVLRSVVHQPARRMVVTAVATIASFVNVPVVYFSVKWWSSIHQLPSDTGSVDTIMALPLAVSAFGTAFLTVGFIGSRRRLAWKRLSREDAAPDLPELPPPLDLEVG